jgi:hypothetical protein
LSRWGGLPQHVREVDKLLINEKLNKVKEKFGEKELIFFKISVFFQN